MKRSQTTNWFSRNGIRISKTTNTGYTGSTNMEVTYRSEKVDDKEAHEEKPKDGVHRVRLESPLGFYYTKSYYVAPTEIKKRNRSVSYIKFTLNSGTAKYELEYPNEYFDGYETQKICVDMRPWDVLPKCTSFPSDLIPILIRETSKFLDVVGDNWNSLSAYNKKTIYYDSYNEIKSRIIHDLFWDIDSIKESPNDIKILSHGFDLKESFRKRKEASK